MKFVICTWTCICLCLCTLMLIIESKKSPNDAEKTSFGNEFVFVFPLFVFNIDKLDENALKLYVLITNQDSQSNNITLTTPDGTIQSYQLKQNESKQFGFNNLSLLVYEQSTKNILIVDSENQVSVHAGIKYNNVGDSFMVLPTTALDSHYIVTTAFASLFAVNQIIIIPLRDKPALVQHRSCDGSVVNSANVSFPATYVFSCAQDLSGNVITSSVPVAVMSGLISHNSSDKFGTEMLIPDKYWGQTFVLSNVSNTESSVFKVVASLNETSLYENCILSTTFNTDKPFFVNFSSGGYKLIQVSNPVSIFQIPTNAEDKLSMFMQVPSLRNFNDFHDLFFSIPILADIVNYGTTLQIGGNVLTIDGNHLQQSNSIFNEISVLYFPFDTKSGQIASLQFSSTAARNALDLSRISTHAAPYSLIQYGISESSLVYGHVTAVTLGRPATPDINFEPMCDWSSTKEHLPSLASSSLPPHSSRSTQGSISTTAVHSTIPTLRTTTVSQIEKIIDDLANLTYTNVANATDVLTILNDTLTEVNQTGYPLTPKDLKNVANILCNCSIVSELADQDFFLYMDCYNQVLNQNIQTIRDAQAVYNASTFYQVCLQYMASNTVNSSLVYSNVNIAAANLDTNCALIDSSDTSAIAFVQYSNSSIELISNLTTLGFNGEATAAFAILPATSLCDPAWSQKKTVRNSFVLYQGQQFFGSMSNNYSVTDDADGCTVQRSPQTDYVVTVKILINVTESSIQLTQPVSYGFSVDKTDQSLHSKLVCGYWGLEWYTNGCYLQEVQGDMYICQCTHLTDFSLLVDSSATDPSLCDQTLKTLGIVVTALSSAGLFATLVLTFIRKVNFLSKLAFVKLLFNNNRKTKSVVGDTLMVTLFLFYILFAILADSRVTNMSSAGCNASGAVLYTVLFATMFFAAFSGLTFFKVYYIVFRHDVLNFVTSKLFIVGVSLGVPTLITIILWFSFNQFFVRNDGFCWINPRYVSYAIVIPTGILMLGDIIITGLLIKGFFFAGNKAIQSAKGRKKMMFKKVFVLVTVQFILACPWIFEYFTIGTPEVTAFHYLFTLTNGTQGIWLSLIYLYSFFKFTKTVKKAKKQGTVTSQMDDSVRTKSELKSTPGTLQDNRKFPISLQANKVAPTLTPDKYSPAMLMANGSTVSTLDKVPALKSEPILIPRPDDNHVSSSKKLEPKLSYGPNSPGRLGTNGVTSTKVVLVSDKESGTAADKKKVQAKLSLDGGESKKHLPSLPKKSDSYFDLLHGSRPLGSSPNKS